MCEFVADRKGLSLRSSNHLEYRYVGLKYTWTEGPARIHIKCMGATYIQIAPFSCVQTPKCLNLFQAVKTEDEHTTPAALSAFHR